MRKTTCLALITALVAAVPSTHALIITGTATPASTVSVSGTFSGIPAGTMLDRYLITADSETAANLTAFELTFTGTFAQVQNASFGTNTPSPLATDVGGFPAAALAEDTHFIPNLTLPGAPEPPPTEGIISLGNPGSGFSNDLLSHKVAIAGPSQSPVVVLAQILMMQGATGSFSGAIAVAGNPNPIAVSGMIGGDDPNSGENTAPVVDDQLIVCSFGIPCSLRQLVAMDAEDGNDANLIWDTAISLTGPGVPSGTPTLTADGKFSWDPTGSVKGLYTTAIKVTDSGGLMDTAVLSVQVPEPGVFVLAGMSLIGMIVTRRRLS